MRDSALSAPFESVTDSPVKMNRRQAAKVRTRHKVIEAARVLFAERGYEPATIRDIASGAGMSTGAVFANFQDKAELFEAVLTDEMDTLRDVMREAGSVDGSVTQRLAAALNAGYELGLTHLPLMQAIVARSWFQPLDAEVRARATLKGLLIVINDILRDGVRAGELAAAADTRLLGEMVWDAYLLNYRKAAYDDWGLPALSERLAAQIDVILASAVSRAA